MKFRTGSSAALMLAFGTLQATGAWAEGLYVAGSLGTSTQASSTHSGSFSSAFTTGEVTGVTPALTIPAGAAIGWYTEFSSDVIYSGAFGYDYGNIRAEVALGHTASNVSRHGDVTAAGMDLSGIDVGVLIPGNTGDRGISIARLVSNAAGDMQTTSLMLNGYYELESGWEDLTPFVGLGIGYARTDVSFVPSNTPVVGDDDSGLAWQVMVGADYAISDSLSFFGNYRYFAAEDATVDVSLVPATLDIKNRLRIFEVGLKFSF